ncbi:MAG: FkbM family methyltransferase [Ignavibacteria bacterium]
MQLREFRNELVHAIYAGMYQRLGDNFDFVRFGYDGVDRSTLVNVHQNAAYFSFVLDNIESFYAAWLLLEDADSRALFKQLIKYRCLGHPHLRIHEDMTWTAVKASIDRAASYVRGPSEIRFSGMFGPLLHHVDVPAEDGTPVTVDAWTLNVAFDLGCGSRRQYYLRRGDLRVQPEAGDWIIDGGACFGDTAAFFATSVGRDGRVFAFEPLPVHAEVIELNARQNGLQQRLQIVPAGLGDASNTVTDIGGGLARVTSPGFSMAGREDQVPIVSIDDFVAKEKLERLDFIKLDIEGFELKALKGAADSIARFRPKLAISLYHKPEDFFEIPIFLKTNFPFYRLHLEHYTIFAEETVLYAVAG